MSPNKTRATRPAIVLFSLALAIFSRAVIAESHPPTDCPLRDQPYSIQTPLMDILLKPEAVAIVNSHMQGVLDKMPRGFVSSEPPSFSAILDLKGLAALAGLPEDSLPAIDRELAQLPLTDADRTARCARYDFVPPSLEIPKGDPAILLFEKINGYRDGPSVEAASKALKTMAAEHGWALVQTENGAVMTPELLSHFDLVIWNNISGDVLTLTQRQAFIDYIRAGGGFLGIHGSGGDPMYLWDWYVDELIGARFIGHTKSPQFQDATVNIHENRTGIGKGMPAGFSMNDEWYSFAPNPGDSGAAIIATLDESTYTPGDFHGRDLRMGNHPIAWAHCLGKGRSFYSAIGHRPETYSDPHYVELLYQAILWAAGEQGDCPARVVTR